MTGVADDDVDSGTDVEVGNDFDSDDEFEDSDDSLPETELPADAEPLTCPYCGFDLPEETQYRLHLGLEHYGRLDEAEQEGFKESYRSENDALDRFRIIALGGLVLLYFGFLVVYALLAA